MLKRETQSIATVCASSMGTHMIGEVYCMVCLAYFAGGSSDSSEDSTYSLRSSASLPPRPVNHAVQHFRGLRQGLTPVKQ